MGKTKHAASHLAPTHPLWATAALYPRGCEPEKILAHAADYFTANRDCMHYPAYTAHSWPRGSGIVESACRLVSRLRVK